MNTLPSWLAPVAVDDLIRVGGEADGGYVVPERQYRNSDALLSFGFGYSWQFENDYKADHPYSPIEVYDPTVTYARFRKDWLVTLASYLCLQSSWTDVVGARKRLASYRALFWGRPPLPAMPSVPGAVDVTTHVPYTSIVTHHHQFVTPDLLHRVFRRLPKRSIFLSMDIDGGEYDVLPAILEYRAQMSVLAVEFHDTCLRWTEFERVVRATYEHYAIVHVHGNNFGGVGANGVPEALEITFARRDTIPTMAPPRTRLPIALDRPNDPKRPEIALVFA
jgi:hypothetical protein